MTFACQNDECEEHVKYGNYFKHMTKECKIKTYKAATMPEGAFNNQDVKSVTQKHLELWGGYNIMCADMFYLYYVPDEDERDNYFRVEAHTEQYNAI